MQITSIFKTTYNLLNTNHRLVESPLLMRFDVSILMNVIYQQLLIYEVFHLAYSY